MTAVCTGDARDQDANVSMDGRDLDVMKKSVMPNAINMDPVRMEPASVTRDGMERTADSMDARIPARVRRGVNALTRGSRHLHRVADLLVVREQMVLIHHLQPRLHPLMGIITDLDRDHSAGSADVCLDGLDLTVHMPWSLIVLMTSTTIMVSVVSLLPSYFLISRS